MSDLRRMLPSSNALFVFEAAARTGSFTRAAAELSVTQPAVSRMLSRLEAHLGTPLFRRNGRGAVLTPDGEVLFRRVAEGFRAIEAGLREVQAQGGGKDAVTLSVSSAFMTHWLMPRMDRFQREFPTVDLRFQMIAGSLRGPVENVDLGMRFLDAGEAVERDSFVSNEVILPVCSPAYLRDVVEPGVPPTIIHLSDTQLGWADPYGWPAKADAGHLTFSDYAVVIQVALLGQGIAWGYTTVVSNALLGDNLVPAAGPAVRKGRVCVLLPPRARPMRPVVRSTRAWIIAELRSDLDALEKRYPDLGLLALSYDACHPGDRGGNDLHS